MSVSALNIAVRQRFADFALDLEEALSLSGCLAVFGPSGAGKSTLLRLIAGFMRPQSGRISFGDICWCDTVERTFVPAHRRAVGSVFQNGRLFPHLNVEQNLLYADRRFKGEESRYSVDEIIGAFDLSPLLHRRPDTLSGGERQRAALARTLLTRPTLLLLDEPLSALDRARKAEILPYLEDLPGRFGAPVIYVSHNVDEIALIADRTLVLKAGRVEATGPTADILTAYGADAAADGIEPGAVIAACVTGHDDAYQLTHVEIGGGVVSLPINKQKRIGETVNIRITARNVAIAMTRPQGISIRNILPATVVDFSSNEASPFASITLRVGDAQLISQVTRAACAELGLAQGQSVFALVKTASFDL